MILVPSGAQWFEEDR